MTGRGPRDRDEEFARELQDHLALEAEDREAAGLSADQAKYAALRAFGNTAIVKEDVREVWTWTALHSFARNVRFAMRMLFKNPGFAAVAITTLALGIGANTAIFTVVNGLLIRPLPYNEPDALVVPSTIFKRSNSDRGSVSYADIRDWKSQTHLLTAVAAATPAQFDVTGGEGSERVAGLLVDHDYFRVITDRPLVGRTFTAEEDQPGANRVVMLSEAAWMRRFGGDPNVVGKSIEISGEMHRIVGVFPKTLDDKMEVLKPLALGSRLSADTLRRDNHVYWAVGRLAPGVTLEKARSQFTAMGARIAQEHSNRAQTGLKLHRLRDYIVGPTLGRILWVLLAAVLLLLIIACVNVANLLLARSAARQREVGIRVALGAGWRALAAQFAAESLVLTVLGAVLGVLVGIAGHKALIRYAPEGVPALSNVAVDANVLAFTLLVSAGTAVLFGMAPLIQALGKAPGVSVRQSGRSSTAGAGERRLRAVLVISELALAVILLSAAGLLVRSFQRLQSVEPGFATENRLTLNLGLPRSRYAAGEPTVQAFRQILDKVERLPGVVSA
ncbi:MAG TPA: ABC transporter permease, partial [Bryobacteraceae bacterium]|nr:ABC transporter permease [Bryobacteraceae bacterium]